VGTIIAYASTANAAVNGGSGALVAAQVTVVFIGADITPPVISSWAPFGQLVFGTTQQVVSVTSFYIFLWYNKIIKIKLKIKIWQSRKKQKTGRTNSFCGSMKQG